MMGSVWHAVRCRPETLHLSIFFVAFILAAGLGQWLGSLTGSSIILWPPNGVFLATLLINAGATWPWWIAVGFLAELTCNALWFHNSLLLAPGYFAANALEATIGAGLLRRWFPRPVRFESLPQVVALILVVGFAPTVAATIGSLIDVSLAKHAFWSAWTLWWIGDATGVLIAAPLTLVIAEMWRERPQFSAPRIVEACAVALVLVAVAGVALGGHLPFAYIIMPSLLWAAVRFDFKGAAMTSALLALMVAVFTARGTGSFSASALSQAEQHIVMQLFLAVSAIVSLIVAAISLQSRQLLARLTRTNEELETRVAARTAQLGESEQRFRTLASQAPVGIFQTDVNGHCLFVNEKWCELAGMPANAALGLGWVNALHPDDRNRVFREWHEAAQSGREFASEYRFQTPTGRTSWLKGSALALRDAGEGISGYLGSVNDITELKNAQQRQELLINELNHRVKNTLATVQAVAAQTLRGADVDPDLRERFEGRLLALSSAQNLLTRENWQGADIGALVRQILESHVGADRFHIDGPAFHLAPQAAVALTMAVHELATNAIKYGALSNETGEVAVCWRVTPCEPSMLLFEWRERGGPPVAPATRKGFGSRLIEHSLPRDLEGQACLSFEPDGLVCTITGRLSRAQARRAD